jgi:cysteine-rich repeat protein
MASTPSLAPTSTAASPMRSAAASPSTTSRSITFEFCGNGIREGAELCDDGNAQGGDGCTASCVVERCGDGERNNRGREDCDDNNTQSGDGCSATCAFEFCGNGTREGAEACDDGNAQGGDGCTASCVVERCAGGGGD